jgi:hypothetical protein
MTAESRRTRDVLVPILAVAAIAVIMRYTFVDLLTKTTGTWIGGVESPSPKGRGAD